MRNWRICWTGRHDPPPLPASATSTPVPAAPTRSPGSALWGATTPGRGTSHGRSRAGRGCTWRGRRKGWSASWRSNEALPPLPRHPPQAPGASRQGRPGSRLGTPSLVCRRARSARPGRPGAATVGAGPGQSRYLGVDGGSGEQPAEADSGFQARPRRATRTAGAREAQRAALAATAYVVASVAAVGVSRGWRYSDSGNGRRRDTSLLGSRSSSTSPAPAGTSPRRGAGTPRRRSIPAGSSTSSP